MATPPPQGQTGAEALADQLSACADALHARILKDLKARGAGQVDEAAMAAARALLDEELLLRQRANALYADAAGQVVGALGQQQQHIATLTAAAAERIRTIGVIADLTGVVGALAQLGAAAAAGQAAPVVTAVEALSKQVKSLAARRAAKPA
jgi:hypothetical protein